jgi:DNA topoisomerase I
MEKQRFIPEDQGRIVSIFLENFFGKYVEYDFTADLENQLDLVSAGDLDWKVLLRDFWTDFNAKIVEMGALGTREVIDALDETLSPYLFPARPDGADTRLCPKCGEGRLSLKPSRTGAFVGCSNYPECRFTRPFGAPSEDGEQASGDVNLGPDPVTGETVWLKSGRFGPYVQLGEGDKPKRASLPKGWSAPDMDLEKALRLLRLPREVGPHPEDGQMILAGIGRYGPFVLHEKTYASLSTVDEVFEVGVNRAVDLIATKRAGRRGGGAPAGKHIGDHTDGQPIHLMPGRYGPYFKHGSTNANAPKGADPETVTLEEAIKLIDERAAKSGGAKTKKPAKAKPKPRASGSGATTKKSGTKSPGTKKPPAKPPASTPDDDDEAPF